MSRLEFAFSANSMESLSNLIDLESVFLMLYPTEIFAHAHKDIQTGIFQCSMIYNNLKLKQPKCPRIGE